jgi:hypothetical protein
MRMSLLALACATLLLAACSSSSSDTPADAEGDVATDVPTATATEADAGDSSDVDTSDAADDDDGDAAVAILRYIGNTGGSGVAVRNACAQDARAGGAWPDATEVLVLEVGSAGCDGWSLVSREGTSLESWVRNSYLVTDRPTTTTVSRPPSSTSTPRPTSTSTPTSTPPTPAPTQPPTPVTYPQISISPNPLNFGEIPPNQVSARSVLLTNTSTEAVKITSVVFENGTHISSPFEVTDNCDGQIVNANTACRIVVRFTPLTGGQHSATLLISTNSATAPLTALVLGTGFIAD